MNSIVLVLIVYLGLLAAFAIWSRHETGSLSGFYLAGKKLPFWVVAFSTNATGESGWLLLGLTGMGYAVGAKAYWVVVGEVVGIALSWWLISCRLKRLSDETDSITVPDVRCACREIQRSVAPDTRHWRVRHLEHGYRIHRGTDDRYGQGRGQFH